MRKFAQSQWALVICASLLAPAAFASIAPPASHACCHHQAKHERCSAMGNSDASLTAAGACHKCCLCSTLREPVRIVPASALTAIAPATQHPFLEEFFPADNAAPAAGTPSPRAPPQDASR
jgi:hypothetical protein